MKKLYALSLIGILLSACEKEDPWTRDWPAGSLTDGFCISFADSIFLNHEDIACYDMSTHMIYLREPLSLLQDQVLSELAEIPFTVYADSRPVYTGKLWPAWFSMIPSGPFIQYPSFYPAYVVPIGYRSSLFTTRPDTLTDPREDAIIVQALEKYDQLREGLSVSIDEIDVHPGGGVSFSFIVTNRDDTNYYILSPEKMGSGLFHYFTNGLFLYNQETGWLVPHEEEITPEPWDSWDPQWLDLLKGNSSLQYSIEYELFDEVPPGHYDASFRFPGLSHVEQSDIERSRGRIWLGEISASSVLTLN